MDSGNHRPVCIVTGGNSGVGLMTAMGLAKSGYQVILACRSAAKAAKAIDYICQKSGNPHVEFLPLDLSSLDSVRTFVELFLAKQINLQILVNNAGIFNKFGTTQEGFELIWGTNYLGHFLLTYLLLEKLKASAPSRIILVASDLALRPTAINWNLLVKKTPLNFLELYAVSKLCLLLFAAQLARHLNDSNVTVNAVHPGFVRSNITWGHQMCKFLGLGLSLKEGAYSSLYCATSEELTGVSGKFFNPRGQEIKLPEIAKDAELARELWERSLLWTGCSKPQAKSEQVSEADAELFGPYSLGLTEAQIAAIAKNTLEEVLPKAPTKFLVLSLLSFLYKLEFGSFLLLLLQIFKKEFHMERHLESPAIWSLCQNQNFRKKLQEHLGEELILWRSEIWVNYPSQQLIPFWHQDAYPKLLEGAGKSINAYIALTEVNESNGFEYIPTASLSNHLSVKVTDPFSGNQFFDVTEEAEAKAIPVVLKPGEFILFTEHLVHRSVRNTSGRVRLSLTLRVTQPGVRVKSGYSPNYKKPVYL